MPGIFDDADENEPLILSFRIGLSTHTITTLNGNSSTSTLISMIQNFHNGGNQLGIQGRTRTMTIIAPNTNTIVAGRYLRDYNLIYDVQVLTIQTGVQGGTLLKKYIRPHKMIKIKKTKCCVFNDRDEDCAVMDCGHTISQKGMHGHILQVAEKNFHSRIFCPVPNCKTLWDYVKCIWIAHMLGEEKQKYKHIFEKRYREKEGFTKDCPGCGLVCKKSTSEKRAQLWCKSCNTKFCFECGKKWQWNKSNRICGNKKCITYAEAKMAAQSAFFGLTERSWITNQPKEKQSQIPKFRLCPSCYGLIHHLSNCPHIRCTQCGYDFCWVCLNHYQHKNVSCVLAKRQTIDN